MPYPEEPECSFIICPHCRSCVQIQPGFISKVCVCEKCGGGVIIDVRVATSSDPQPIDKRHIC